jgi:pyridoxamine 5'-phosphate oxidase
VPVDEWPRPAAPAGPAASQGPPELATIRRSYLASELTELTLAATWDAQLARWYADAAAEPSVIDPNAMQVATVDAEGTPDVRTVLARGFGPEGVVFYTNYSSAKGRQLAANPQTALLFSWLPLERQVRLRGTASRVSRAQTEKYFAGRPRGSQIGAWASPQSEIIASRETLLERECDLALTYQGREVPAPPGWGGFRVSVELAEFWQGRENRLHDRLRYRLVDGDWIVERLAP